MPPSQRNRFDEHYFRIMCASKFTLCPGGDQNWSMRFYEALMCKSIPILFDRAPFRTRHEAMLPYRYFLAHENIEYIEEWAEHNHALFMKHHTLRHRRAASPDKSHPATWSVSKAT